MLLSGQRLLFPYLGARGAITPPLFKPHVGSDTPVQVDLWVVQAGYDGLYAVGNDGVPHLPVALCVAVAGGPVVRETHDALDLPGGQPAGTEDAIVHPRHRDPVAHIAGAGSVVGVDRGGDRPGGPEVRPVLQSVPDAAEPFAGGGVVDPWTRYSVTVPAPLRVTVHLPANVDSKWKYRSLGDSSKMSNNEDPFPGLRN